MPVLVSKYEKKEKILLIDNIKQKNFILVTTLAFLYFSFGKVSLVFLGGNGIVAIGIFASQGIALAFVIFFGLRVVLGIFIGQLLFALSNDLTLISSLGISLINSLIVMLAYMIFHKFKLTSSLQSFRDIFGLVILIVSIEFIGSLSNNTFLLFTHAIESNIFINSTFFWWFGNVMGELLFTPFLLLLFSNFKTLDNKNLAIYGIAFALYMYIIGIIFAISNAMVLLSLTLPIIIFLIAYKGFIYGTFFSLIVASISSYSVYQGVGAFVDTDSMENIINHNLFILSYILVLFVVGVLFQDKEVTEKLLQAKIKDEVQKNEQQQLFLLHQSRLAQMGEMISMIAHQWRQPLNNLSLSNQLLILKYKKGKLDDAAMEHFKKSSNKQITQMSRTIDDFRDFFKENNQEQEFSVNEVIGDVLNLTQDLYSTQSIDLSFEKTTNYVCLGNSSELGQALLNIINNAKDALIENKIEQKFIKIALTSVENQIIISIEDNAGGIPQKIQDKIFDPYFSTKDEKNGTGLGLYMTKMIISDKLQGKIDFKNTEDGVIFKIYLKEQNNATK